MSAGKPAKIYPPCKRGLKMHYPVNVNMSVVTSMTHNPGTTHRNATTTRAPKYLALKVPKITWWMRKFSLSYWKNTFLPERRRLLFHRCMSALKYNFHPLLRSHPIMEILHHRILWLLQRSLGAQVSSELETWTLLAYYASRIRRHTACESPSTCYSTIWIDSCLR